MYVFVCPRAYLESLDRSTRNFVCRSPVAVARSSSGGVALCYVLPVLWMTSRLAVIGATPGRVGSTQRRRSTTCATGAESEVYECLFFIQKNQTERLLLSAFGVILRATVYYSC